MQVKNAVYIKGPGANEVSVFIYDRDGHIYHRHLNKRDAVSYVKSVQEHGYWYCAGDHRIICIHPREIIQVEIHDIHRYLTENVGTHVEEFFGRIGEN